jgi:glycerol-3-phosphate acyltransferase PlsY
MNRDLLVFVLGYLVGSIPTGLWLGHIIGGVDVRTVGSRRTGATNVQRSLGTGAGVAVLVLDFVKGMVPVLAVSLVTGNQYLAGLAGIAAVVGHVWPVFAGFRGGRGVATAGGALVLLVPFAVLLTFLVLVAVVALTRYVSLGSIMGTTLVTVVVVLLRGHVSPHADAGILVAFVSGSLILLKHADNLGRLMRGSESRLGRRRS